jgi:hypothetical protein
MNNNLDGGNSGRGGSFFPDSRSAAVADLIRGGFSEYSLGNFEVYYWELVFLFKRILVFQ